MTDFESTLIDSTKELMDDLMRNLSSIESVEIVKEFVEQGEIVILLPDGALKKLTVISEEGRSLIKQHIMQQLDYELSESLTKLKYITDAHTAYRFEPVEEAPVEEPAEEPQKPAEEPVKPEKKSSQGKKVNLDINEIEKYRAKGWSLKKIAARFGVCEQTVLNYINKAEKSRKEQAS